MFYCLHLLDLSGVCACYVDRMYTSVFFLGLPLCDDAADRSSDDGKPYCVCNHSLLYVYCASASAGYCGDGGSDRIAYAAFPAEPNAGHGGVSGLPVSVQSDSCHG